MRVIVAFLALMLALVTTQKTFSQNSIQLSKDDLDILFQQAKKEHKNVLFMGYASWCSHCNNMKANVLTDSAVAAFYNAHFITAGRDMEKEEGRQLQPYFQVKSFPTFIFLDTAGRTLYRIAGEFDAKSFLEQGHNALDPHKQLPYLKSRFEADVSNGKNCLDYIMALRMGQLKTEKVAKAYFATKPEDSLLTELNWRIFANGTNDLTSREFRFTLAHQKEYAALTSPERVKRKILYATYESLNQLALDKDTAGYFAQRAIVASTRIYAVDSLLFTLDLDLYENTGNWQAYEKTSMQFTDVYAATEFNLLKNIANNYLQYITDGEGLRKATTWAEKSLAMWENYQTALIAAKLYRKLNDAANTKRMAGQAKAIAVKTNASTAELDKMLLEQR